MDVRAEHNAAMARGAVGAKEQLVLTGLMQHLGRKVSMKEAVQWASEGRLRITVPLRNKDEETYHIDGNPFLFIGALDIITDTTGDGYRLTVNWPYRFIPAPPSQQPLTK